jgi:hypothetical protein
MRLCEILGVDPVGDTEHHDVGQADQQRAHARSIRFQAGAPRDSTTSDIAENRRAPAPRRGPTRPSPNPQTRSAVILRERLRGVVRHGVILLSRCAVTYPPRFALARATTWSRRCSLPWPENRGSGHHETPPREG